MSHSILHAQPLQIPDDSADDSDQACRQRRCSGVDLAGLLGNGERRRWVRVEWGGIWGGVSPLQPTKGSGERRELPQRGPEMTRPTTKNDPTSATVQTAESVAASSDTSDCREVCLLQKREDVALWCCAGILDSVAVAQILTLSHPWTVVARYVVHPFAWCCACLVKCTLTRI